MKTESLNMLMVGVILIVGIAGLYFLYQNAGMAVKQPVVVDSFCQEIEGTVYCECDGAGTAGKLANGESVFGACDRLCNLAGQGNAAC